MGRVIVEGVFPIVWIVYTVWITMSRWKYKRLVAISDNPLLALSRHAQREYAQELLERQKAQYTEDVYRHLIEGSPLHPLQKKGENEQ